MSFINKLLFFVFIIGIWGAGILTIDEIFHRGSCPKMGVIPACYIVLGCFIISFLNHIFKGKNIYFYLFTGFAFALAIFASIGQIIEKIQCPKTDFGFPMCYLSFLIFGSLIFLKMRMEKLKE